MRWSGLLIRFAFGTGISAYGAATFAVAIYMPPEPVVTANSSARINPLLTTASNSLVCRIWEANSRARCYGSCGQEGVSSYTPGVCGVGSKCSCAVSPVELPIGHSSQG